MQIKLTYEEAVRLVNAIENYNLEEYGRILRKLRLSDEDLFLPEELFDAVLSIFAEKLSKVFVDPYGSTCQIYYEPTNVSELPKLKGEFPPALIKAVQSAPPEVLASVLEEENLFAGLIKKLGLEKVYADLLVQMEKYPGRFNVFSLFRVYVRIGIE